MNAFVEWLLDLLYPPRCAFCRRLLNDAERGVCRFCRRRYADAGTRRELKNGLLCVAPSCDMITWVPLSRRRLRKRGYDQARILAEETAKRLGIPCEKLLKKKIDTRPQSGIHDAEARRNNAKGVYVCCAPEKAKGRRVLVIDDIVTTGATLSECASELRKAGCAEVYAAAAASRH